MVEQDKDAMISLRATAAQAFGLVKGSEAVETFSAYTFEEALQQQVDRLEKGGEMSLSASAQIDKIQADLTKVREGLTSMPTTIEEALENPDDNVNTPE
jgi:hypothetical protein